MIAPSTGARPWPMEQPRLCRPCALTRRSAGLKPDATRKFGVSAAHRGPQGTVESSSGKSGKKPARRAVQKPQGTDSAADNQAKSSLIKVNQGKKINGSVFNTRPKNQLKI